MASFMDNPQKSTRTRGSTKCHNHYGKEVIFFCENCHVLACTDCVTGEHKGHDLETLINAFPTAKHKLQDYIKNLEQTKIPRMKGVLQKAENNLAENRKYYTELISEVNDRNESLKTDLDAIAETIIKTCYDMEQKSSDELLNYMRDLQTRIDKLTSQIHEDTRTLQSGNDILVLDRSLELSCELELLPTPICNTPKFIQKTPYLQNLRQLFGALNIPDNLIHISKWHGNWRVTSEFKPRKKHWAKSLNVTGDDKALFSFVKIKPKRFVEKILLTDNIGHPQLTVDTDVWVYDACLSPKTGDIWYCGGQDKSVRQVKDGKSINRFTKDSVPRSICITYDDHVVIGHPGHVVKYTQRGQEVCRTLGGSSFGLISSYHIRECPLTSNFAVADLDQAKDGGNDKPSVLILNARLQPLYKYTGDRTGQESPLKPFFPMGICYTDDGELVISDRDRRTVLLVSGAGRYLLTLYTHSKTETAAICVHNDALWLASKDGKVQILKNTCD